MSEANVEIVLECARRYEAKDFEGFAALCHPECRATPADGWPEPGPFVGRNAVVAQYERLAADWSEHHIGEMEVVADTGDWVVMTYRWNGRGMASGIETHIDVASAFRVEDGLLREMHNRWDTTDALEAAGLSE